MKRCHSIPPPSRDQWLPSRTDLRGASRSAYRGSLPGPCCGEQGLRPDDVGVEPAPTIGRSPSPEQPVGPLADGLAPDGSLDPRSSHVHHPPDALRSSRWDVPTGRGPSMLFLAVVDKMSAEIPVKRPLSAGDPTPVR